MKKQTTFVSTMILHVLVLLIGLKGLDGATQSGNQTCSHEAKKPAVCLEIGEINILDRELHREELQKSAFILYKKEDDIVFPPGGASSNWFTLTYVNVTNLMPSGKEGRVTLTDGGVGHRNVTLHLESQRGEGYHFLVVIRGKDSSS